MARRRYRRQKKRSRGAFYLGLLLLAIGVWWVVTTVLPNETYTVPDWKGLDKPIFVQGELKSEPAQGAGEALLLPITVIQESVDENIRYEQETESVIITTPESVLRLKMGSTKGELNGKETTIPHAPELIDGIAYVPIKPLKQYYGVVVHENSVTGAIILMRAGDSIQLAEAAPAKPEDTVDLRENPEKKSSIILDMPVGERLRVWREEEDWLYVQADNGYTGYVLKQQTKLGEVKEIPLLAQTPSRAELEWKDKSVNLVWEAVYSKNPSTDQIGKLPGVNVVSPTWFHIVDEEGNVDSKASMQYVNWAHHRNMEVWGLMDNSFDPEITTAALSTFDRRSHIIKQMLTYAKQYKLDGINLDFENVHTKDKDHVVQFVRELKPLAKARGLIVSIDVTPKSNSEMWSLFLDRKRLGETVDYMMVMAYDEHWASSPKAGSVSSLPWAEQSVRRILEEDAVPSSKLVLGIPLYTRVWTETSEAGETKVSSKAIGMEKLQNLLEEQKVKGKLDASTGQNYVQFTEEESLIRIWMEDAISLQSRVYMAKKLELGGIASWNRSLAIPETWEVLKTIHD